MTRLELITGLHNIIQASKDAARAARAEAEAFRPEYDAALAKRSRKAEQATAHARALELYPRVVSADTDALRHDKDVAILETTIRLLQRLSVDQAVDQALSEEERER